MKTSSHIETALENRRTAALHNLPVDALPYFLNRQKGDAKILLLVESNEVAFDLETQIKAYGLKDVAVLPDISRNPYDDLSYNVPLAYLRQALRYRLLDGTRPEIIITTLASLQCFWASSESFLEHTWTIACDDELPRDEIAEKLILNGYQRVDLCEDVGTFAVRGSIIDVYTPEHDSPIRLDLFGDTIASLKFFNPATQRTFQKMERVNFYPIREIILSEENKESAIQELQALGDSLTIPTRKIHSTIEEVRVGNYFFGIEALWPAFFPLKEKVFDQIVEPKTIILSLYEDGAEEQISGH